MTPLTVDQVRARLYLSDLCDAAAAIFGLRQSDLLARHRNHMANEARHLVAIKARSCGLTLQEIGTALERDHSTVVFYLENAEAYRARRFYREIMDALPEYRPDLYDLTQCRPCGGTGFYVEDIHADIEPRHKRRCGACAGLGYNVRESVPRRVK